MRSLRREEIMNTIKPLRCWHSFKVFQIRTYANKQKDKIKSSPSPSSSTKTNGLYKIFSEAKLNVMGDPLQTPTLKEFTSNPNHKIDLSIFNRLKPITPNDSFVSCTIFDTKGNNIGISKTFPKMQFLKDHNLYPRDLRKIDTSAIDVAPQIMVRPPTTILVNLLHIKALIKQDQVMIFDTSTPEIATKLGLFIYDLELKLKAKNSTPFEFKVLETILVNIMGYLEAELKIHIENCGSILTDLENLVDRMKLQDLLIRLKSLQSYNQKALLIKNVLEELLDNEDDLQAMYLTSKPSFNDANEPEFEEVENILEAYYGQCDEFVQHSGSMANDIKSTEDIVNIILDANRNELMLFELKVSIYTLGITVATLIPAFYGMNLKNFIEDSIFGFGLVVVFSIIQGIMITRFNLHTLKRVQTLTMMGGGGRNNRQLLEKSLAFKQDAKKKRWLQFLRKRNRFHFPSSKESRSIWRMINENRNR